MESNVTVLESAGREEQLKRHGLSPSPRWAEAERRPRFSDELDASDPDAEAGHELEELGFLQDGGWSTVDTTRGHTKLTNAPGGARDAGMSSHRGVLHPDEHVDADALRSAVEAELGFTYDDVRAVYRQGKKSNAQLELRARIEARLLELSRAGGLMLELGRSFGWAIDEQGRGANCRTMERALERARDNEENAT